MLIGGPGTGKTHIATAIGVQAVAHHRKKVRFYSTVELVTALEQEEAQGKSGQIAEPNLPPQGIMPLNAGHFSVKNPGSGLGGNQQ